MSEVFYSELYDDVATHHPNTNFNAQMVDGILRNVERPQRRSHAFIDGEYQETETPRTDEDHSLKPDQVLLIKDFILEDVPAAGVRTRVVDVPAPVAGYVSRRDDRNRPEVHTSELQSLMRISYAVFCLNHHKLRTQLTSYVIASVSIPDTDETIYRRLIYVTYN